MGKQKKSKEERQRDRKIIEQYHQKVTEDTLEPLYQNFQEWKNGNLPYYELTEKVLPQSSLQSSYIQFSFLLNIFFRIGA